MSDPIFDLDNWKPMFKISKDMAVDSDGNFSILMGENMAMDMDSGEMHFTTSWGLDNDFDDDI